MDFADLCDEFITQAKADDYIASGSKF